MPDSDLLQRARKFQTCALLQGYGVKLSLADAAVALGNPEGLLNLGEVKNWRSRMIAALALSEKIGWLRDRGHVQEEDLLREKVKRALFGLDLSLDAPADKKCFCFFVQGRLLCSVLEFDLSQKTFLQANRRIPGISQIAEGLFICAFALSHRRKALFWASRLVSLEPTKPEHWIKLATCWAASGIGCEAQNCLEQALELDPGNTYYRNFLLECDDSGHPDL